MSFRSSGRILLISAICLCLFLPGCCSPGELREKVSSLNLWPRPPARRTAGRRGYPTPSYPKTACPEGPWPNRLPATPSPEPEKASRVIPPPEPEVEPGPEEAGPAATREAGEDPLSVPLPSPPRLPTQSKNMLRRGQPPALNVPDDDDAPAATSPRGNTVLRPEPELTDEPRFVPQPLPQQGRAPRLAERIDPVESVRQPVQLEAPEPFEAEEANEAAEQEISLPPARNPLEAVPPPPGPPLDESLDQEEEFDLSSVPSPAE